MSAKYRIVVDPDAETGLEFRGGCLAILSSVKPEAIVGGPSDTGKTVACCVKLHLNCQFNPGSQHAMVRKTFASMAGSVCQTWERIIVGAGVKAVGADSPRLYTYPNGSQVWVGGMDRPDKTLSSERDSIYVNQAEELKENEWEYLSTRCTGRAGKSAYPQLYGDCNPSGSKHWIRERAKRGDLDLAVATHKDNPTLYRKDGTLVEDGEVVNGMKVVVGGRRRLDALAKLTGVRGKRLRDGLWVTAEGAVYDRFDPAVHVKVRSRSEMKRFYLTIDDGFTNPAVILEIGEDGDGRWHCFREFYQRGQMREAVVAEARRWHHQHRSVKCVFDAAAPELGRQLAAAGLPVPRDDGDIYGGKGKVLDGIRKVQDRLELAGDGLPRYTIDPCCVEHQNEFESYIWKPEKDEPVKESDHSMDALRYLCDVAEQPRGFSSADWGGSREPMEGVFLADRLEL